MKKSMLAILPLLLVIILFQATSSQAAGLTSITNTMLNDQLNFKLDGKIVIPVGDDGSPVLPISYNGTTYLPVRAIGYLLELGIGYENTTSTVLITKNSNKPAPQAKPISKTGKLIPIQGAVLNGNLKFKLDGLNTLPVGDDGSPVLPISYNGTTYLPVRAIGYLLGLGIDYENTSKTVLISRSGNTSPSQTTNTPGWYFKNYTASKNDRIGEKHPLMGTTSYMYDVWESKGEKGNLTMTHNRYDDQTKKLLAGVTYNVIWSDPPSYLGVGDKPSINYERITIASESWKPNQNSISIDQGGGVYFVKADGTKYITEDTKTSMTMEKEVAKGQKGQVKRIQLILGDGWVYEYHYEWRD